MKFKSRLCLFAPRENSNAPPPMQRLHATRAVNLIFAVFKWRANVYGDGQKSMAFKVLVFFMLMKAIP
jgi:hypothetical protein